MRYASFVSHCFRVFHLDNLGSWEHQRRFCLCSITLVDLSLKTVLRGTNTPHTCIPGLVWQKKKALRFSQFELKVGELGFPFHFLCVSAALYHRGHAAAIFFPLVEYGQEYIRTRVCNTTHWDLARQNFK